MFFVGVVVHVLVVVENKTNYIVGCWLFVCDFVVHWLAVGVVKLQQ